MRRAVATAGISTRARRAAPRVAVTPARPEPPPPGRPPGGLAQPIERSTQMSNALVRAALAALVLAGAPLVAFGQSTPAEQKIAAARKSIEADPSRHQPYAELALAFARRARETSDPAWYEQAQGALA